MNRIEARKKAEALVAKMTVEEAASQLRYDAPGIERLGVPAYNWWNEALHGVARAGVATSFPQAIGLAATFDGDLVKRLGDVASTEGRAKYNESARQDDRNIYKGLTFWSPNINIFRDPRWGRGQETYGEDPFLTATMGKNYVRGLQGDGETMKAAACAKHFAVHSGPEGLRHSFDVRPSKKDMYETYLPAFKELVDEGVEAIMGAYNRVNGEPCCGSKELNVDILRGDWGFEGHYVSDCGAIADFHQYHKVTETPEESAALALKNGCDVNCGGTYQYILRALDMGLIDEQDIRQAAVRAFTCRYMLGIMEGSEFDSVPYSAVECREHLATAHEASLKSCVMLKNDGILPLDTNKIKTLAVVGPNANSRFSLIGNYWGTSSRYITVLEGLQDALGDDVRVLFSEGSHLFKDRIELGPNDDRVSEAVTVAQHADAVLLVVGLDETLEGEEGDAYNASYSGDKPDLYLPRTQRNLVKKVLEVGKPTIVVMLAGSSMDLEDANEKASAILQGWYPGARGGKAIAELLLGKKSPSGKLPLTFYYNKQLETMPAFEDYGMKGRTYRYFTDKPLYPFGFGLTYGDCFVSCAKAEQGEEKTKVICKVKNAGKMDTEDVVQIYCQNEGSENAPVNPRLCGFKRVFVKSGGEAEVEIEIENKRFLVVNEEGRSVQEGKVVLYAGMGQPDAYTKELTGHESVRMEL
ncbi:MAG: glycoside hydrolase family 3 C-terminal domain-containing protein [Clostridia bacterium]|nr:glycoside hydrolase family 3 C-terminal domain-containing protein [Clostridia bacterium]